MMRPLLLVHGISSNARATFGAPGRFFRHPRPGSLVAYLIALGYRPGKDLFWFSYRTLYPIPVSARRLRDEISKVQQHSGSHELDLITFSLGGIIGKYYILSPLYRGEVQRMIMIAPPFLGSRWANCFKAPWIKSRADLLFPGDGLAMSPQILSSGNQFLKQLAAQPFPAEIETSIIAARAVVPDHQHDLASGYVRWLAGWLGEGDLVVPVDSTRITVHHTLELADNFSIKMIHKFLPCHPKVQALIKQQLGLENNHG